MQNQNRKSQFRLNKRLMGYLQRNKEYSSAQHIIPLLAAIVTFFTFAYLILPAIALTQKQEVLDCHYEVHQHTDACYAEVEDEDGNTHKELVCGQADYVIHTHTDECYSTDDTGNTFLVCTLPEHPAHVHDKNCYEEEEVLVCGKEESEDHTHDASCYKTEKVLVCNQPELHTHTKACYDEDGNLICGKLELKEHKHDKECMKKEEVQADEESVDEVELEAVEESDPPSEQTIEDETDPEGVTEEVEAAPVEEQAEEASTSEIYKTEADETEKPAVEMPAHTYRDTVEGITVIVKAEEGTFPVDTEMKVVSVTDEKTIDKISGAVDGEVQEVSALDISFYYQGNEIEPEKPVQVLFEADSIPKGKDIESNIVHVDDKGETEVIAHEQKEDDGKAIEFEADAFSVYAVVYTVDFHWEVDGKKYDLSIPGGGFISFQDLVEVLGIANKETDDKDENATTEPVIASEENLGDNKISEDTRNFVAHVDKITFSNPELLSVSKVDKDTTVGAIKDALGLKCEYSGDLSEKQIKEINATKVAKDDWALISLKAFTTEETLTVTMNSGDIFTINVTDVQDPLGIDDRTVSFVYLTGQTNTDGTRRGLAAMTYLNNVDIAGTWVSYQEKNGVEYCSEEASVWLFEYDPDQEAYYIMNGYHSQENSGYYLTYDGSASGSGIAFVQGKANAVPLKVERNTDGTYTISDIATGKLLAYNPTWGGQTFMMVDPNNPGYTQTGYTYNSNYSKIHFCLAEEFGSNAAHKATMVSVQDIQPGQDVVIYRRVLQDDYTYKYYAINGNGGTDLVYNNSDSIYWRGDISVEWEIVNAGSGYYYFYNPTTGAYLAPKGDGTVVISNPANMDDVSTSLPGKDLGTYTSKISNWDYQHNVTDGLRITETAANTATVSSVPLLDSDELYFAVRDPVVQKELTEVDTVDSAAKGIKITMFDFDGQPGANNGTININGQTKTLVSRLKFMNDLMGNDRWAQAQYTPGMLTRYLEDGGQYPKIAVNSRPQASSSPVGNTLRDLFTEGIEYTSQGQKYKEVDNLGEVNHIFINSVYEATGYFHYSCFENAAYLNGSNFEVYEQLATNKNDSAAYAQRGNFWPLDKPDPTINGTNNYDTDLNGYGNNSPFPRAQEDVYYVNEGDLPNSFFGMIMEAKFSQNQDGLSDHGDPMVFEFNGDDDLWIYVDGVLILDIGGVHDAFRGKINFKTGLVEVVGPQPQSSSQSRQGEVTYIKEQYWQAHKFPDGSDWTDRNDPRQNDFFTNGGEDNGKLVGTYKDFTTHNFKMFYLERGAGASQLEMSFNLPVLEESQFRIKKELPETQTGQPIQSQYADAAFYYEAYVKENGVFKKVTKQYFQDNSLDLPNYDDKEKTPVVWKTDSPTETVFLIKPGETAVFPAIDDSIEWYVVEVEPKSGSNMLDDYAVSNSDPDNAAGFKEGTKAKEKPILLRNIVTYQNRPDDTLVNQLQIKKKILGKPYNNDDAFEYRIFLENNKGNLVAYSLGEYYQIDEKGRYIYYDGGERKIQAENPNGPYTYKLNGQTVTNAPTPRYAEHTSVNGSLGDIRDGDTIIVMGLLEGTDFYVYERTDYNYMAKDATPVEAKYVFEGTDVTGAYTRAAGEDEPEDPTEHLYDLPAGLGDADSGLIKQYSISEYEQEKAASGAIIQDKDAKVLVKNEPNHPFQIELQKNWPDTSDEFSMNNLTADSKVTFTVKRYKLDTRHGTVKLTPTLEHASTHADPVYEFMQNGTLVKTVKYSDRDSDGIITVTDLPIGSYTVNSYDHVSGYDMDYTVDPATVTVAENVESTVEVTNTYTRHAGNLRIVKTLTGDYSADTGTLTYTIAGKDYNRTETVDIQSIQNGNNTITIQNLPIGIYTITETVTDSTGEHSPSSRTVTIKNGEEAEALFTGTYRKATIPVTIHFGFTPTNGSNAWPSTKQYQLPAGSTISVPFTMRNCQHYDGKYPYGTTPDCTMGELTAYNSNSSGEKTESVQFNIPSNATSFDIYIKSKCDNVSWAPTVNSDPTVISTSGTRSLSVGGKRVNAVALGASANTGYADVTPVTNTVTEESLPDLDNEVAAKKAFVIDTSWNMTVDVKQDGSTYTIKVNNQVIASGEIDTDTGENFWKTVLKDSAIQEIDEDGDLYYYYISEVAETHVPTGMTPSFDMEGDDNDKTLMTSQDHERVLSVTNELLAKGNLTITKNLKKNGSPDTTASGEFFYAVYDAPYTGDVGQTPVITGSVTVTSGGTATSTVEGLPYGTYYVYELTEEGGVPIVSGSDGIDVAIKGTVYKVTNSGTSTTIDDDTADGSITLVNDLKTGFVKLHKVVKYDGHDPADATQKEALAGDYEFNIFSDQGLTQNVGTFTITITNDGTEKYSSPIELPVGTYWIEETPVQGKPIYPTEENPRQIEVRDSYTQDDPFEFTVTNDYYENSAEDTKTIDIEKRFDGLSEEDIPSNFNIILQYTIPQGGEDVSRELTLSKDLYGVQQDGIAVSFEKDASGTNWVWHLIYIPTDATGFQLKETGYDKTEYDHAAFRLNRTETNETEESISDPGAYMPVNMEGPQIATLTKVTAERQTADNTTSFWIDEGTVLLVSLTGNEGTAAISLTSLNNIEREAVRNAVPLPQGPFAQPVEFFSLEQHPTSITPANNRRITVGEDNGRKYVTMKKSGSSQEAVFSVSYYGKSTFNNEIIINRYSENAQIDIVKADKGSLNEDTKRPLPGATFQITRLNEESTSANVYYLTKEEGGQQIPVFQETSEETGDDGKTSFTGLSSGYYEIKEMNTPAGYIRMDEPVYAKISQGTISYLKRPDEDSDPEVSIQDWEAVFAGSSVVFEPASTDYEHATFFIGNEPGASLPHTGGFGNRLFYLIGLMLAAGAGAGLLMKRRWRKET